MGWGGRGAVPVSWVRLRIIKVEQIIQGHKAGEKQGKDALHVAPQGWGWRAETLKGGLRNEGTAVTRQKSYSFLSWF